MEKPIVFAILLVALPLAAWFWAKRLKSLWDTAVAENERAKSQPGAESEERVTDARLEFLRDLFLAALSVGLVIYFLLSLSAPALTALADYLLDFAHALQAYEPLSKGGEMDSIVNVAIRALLSIGAFLITFGVSAAFLPEIFPWEKGTRISNFLSFGTAFFLAATFALWLGTSTTAFGVVIDQLTRGFLGVVTTFLSILFGAIGVYLFWKRLKTLIKPK